MAVGKRFVLESTDIVGPGRNSFILSDVVSLFSFNGGFDLLILELNSDLKFVQSRNLVLL